MCGKKQDLLWLMIVCCASSQITCLKLMIIGDNLTYFNVSDYPAINLTCPPAFETLIGKFCMMNVKPDTASLGHCKTSNKMYFFNITNTCEEYEVRMNETVKDVKLYFLPKECDCLPSAVLNSSDHNATCQTPTTWTTNTATSCDANNQGLNTGCLKIPPVDPGKTCTNSTYDNDTCSGQEGSKHILHFNGSKWTCVDCEISTTATPPSHTTTNTPTTATPPSNTTTNNPTTATPPSHTTTNTPTTATPPSHTTTNNPTTATPPSHTTTNNPTTATPPSHTTTNNPTTIVTSYKTTQNDSHTPTLPQPEETIDLSDNRTTESGKIEASKASATMDQMNSLVADMEKRNRSNVAIVMGNITGILQRQAKSTESKDIKICYSSNQNMINVYEGNQNAKFPWSVNLPSEAFDKSRLETNGSAFVAVLRFPNMGNPEDTVLNNEVYGITMATNISNLTNNIEMFFKQNNLVGEASCSSWDGKGNLTWTTSGCKTVKIDSNTIKCSCSHLTFFAVLMSPPGENGNITAPYVESLSFITSIGCGISMFFLSVGLFMHFLLRKAKSNQATKILMNMFVALFLLDLSFLSNESVANAEVEAACVFIALLMHYSMLTTFTWFFIQALHMYLWLIRQNVSITNYTRKITAFGWTFPAPIVIAVVSFGGYKTMIINATSGKTAKMCWITEPLIHYIVNIGYYALVFLFTAGIFIMIVTKIVQARHIKAADSKRKTFRKQLMMVLSLFLLFGLTWGVAFFSYGAMLIPSYYIFTVLNSFQGFFLFLYYYHIHNDVEGNFSDDPESSSSTTTIVQAEISAVENIYN